MTRSVFLAIPTHTNKLKPKTEATIISMKLEAEALGYPIEECRWVGDCYIPRARSILFSKFIKSGCSDAFWIDDDVGAKPGTFTRMMAHKAYLVAGAYRIKVPEERYPIRWLPKSELWADPDGLLEVAAVPFGYVRFTRDVAMRWIAANPEVWFRIHEEPELKVWAPFDTLLRDHEYFGEDFLFCERMREMGVRVLVDPEIELTHVGRDDVEYTGKLGDWLRQRMMGEIAA